MKPSRGDGRCRPPPAQTRTCGAAAYGSYCGFDASRLASNETSYSDALSRTLCNPWDTRSPHCVGLVSGYIVFASVTGLPSPASADHVSMAIVQQVRRYYTDVRLLPDVPARIMLLASRADPVTVFCPGYPGRGPTGWKVGLATSRVELGSDRRPRGDNSRTCRRGSSRSTGAAV